ncbi:MAG: hypothetical protein CMB80_16700 [Flammeovirgaceae bacterium]|nr:hypothetical protein [Flammeovirgaceae bacterium]MBR07929.1 hypothetical protein [Rickettsiales bacterium]HCX22727.1 hypothetical protein [Cytophagales bacterium]|tara:strand:+ start:847 stop:1806 length:960 start_codon:yes stop_codon:yes gene_type:complete
MPSKNQSNAIGCLLFLVLIVPPFFILPIGAAIGFAGLCTIISFLIAEINRQIGNLRKRRETNKSLISNANEGFVELIAKVIDESKSLTWIKEVPVAYHELAIYQWKPGTSNSKGHWTGLYQKRSHEKYFSISDGSGECFVSLHQTTFHIKSDSKRMNSRQLLQMLTKKGLEDFPAHDLIEGRKIKVEEHYIPSSTDIYFYGILHKQNRETPPDHLFDQKDNKKAIRSQSSYALDIHDWHKMIAYSSQSDIKILTSDYSPSTYIENLVISLKGDSNIQLRSYFGIFISLIAIIALIAIYLLIVSRTYPDLAVEIESLLAS